MGFNPADQIVIPRFRKYSRYASLWLGFLVAILCVCPPSEAANSPTRHLLLLNSYHQSLEWSEEIYAAIKDELEPTRNHIELHVANMDTKRVPYTDAYRTQLRDLYEGVYQDLQFDLIIASDNNAYDFLRTYRDELFPGVPVVFCGVNNFDPVQLQGYDDFTGVVEVFDARASVALALQLHPDTEELLVVNDYLPSGKAWTQVIEKDLEEFEDRLRIRYAGEWGMQRLLGEIERLPEKSLVLLGVFFRDAEDRAFSARESATLISKASRVPVYGLLEIYLGHGLLGGNLISGYYQGQTAAAIARQILAGEDPNAIPVHMQGSNRNMFDYRQLRRWEIDETKLPPGSLVINRPFSFYQAYKPLVWATISALLLLSLIILLLIRSNTAKKSAQRALRAARDNLEEQVWERTHALKASERDLRMLLEHIPLRVFYKNRDSDYVTCNSTFAQDYGLDYLGMQGRNDYDLLPKKLADHYRQSDLRVMEQGESREWEGSYLSNERSIQIHAVKTPVRDEQGEVVGLLGILSDVTEQNRAKAALEESEARFRVMFRESKAVQLLIEPDGGKIIDCNRAAEWFYGYDRDSLQQLSIMDINTLSKMEIKAEMERARREERDHFFFRHRLADGEIRDVEVRSGPIHLSGRPLLYSIIHDVTERRKAEQSLLESEEKYRSLVESVTTEYLVYRHDTQGVFTYVSPSVKAILGYEPEEFMRDYQELLTSNPINREVIGYTNLAIQGERQPPYEAEFYTRQGQHCRLRVSESPLFDENGGVVGVQGIATDITEAWRSGMQLRLRNRVMEMITSKAGEAEILDSLVRHIEIIDPDALCSVLSLDEKRGTLHNVSAPRLPGFYSDAVEGLEIGDGVGSCGTAAFTGQMVIVEDVLNHPYWAPYKDLIEQTPLRACWSQPIISRNGGVLGTFAMYYERVKSPGKDELELIGAAADLAAVAIDTVRAEQSLRKLEERERLLLESSTEGMFGLDMQGFATFVNPAAAEMLGYSVEEITGQPLHELIHYALEDGTALTSTDCRMMGAAHHNRDYHVVDEVLWRKDGSCFPVEYWSTPIQQGDGIVGAMVSFHDISARRQAEERIEHLAFHDTVTGLPNRLLLKQRLKERLAHLKRYGGGFALYLLDLDHFKDVNDSLGHPAGDELLQKVSERLLETVREEDVLARMGGDEFVLIQQQAGDAADVSLLAQRIIETIKIPFEIQGHQVSVGASIGIQWVGESTENSDVLMANADLALYRAKEMGRGQYVFYEDTMTRRLQFEVELINHLPRALQDGELYVVYQTQHRLTDGALSGVEALIRWQHRKYGLISPAEFIPIAEKRGVMGRVGEFVLRSACAQAKQWLEAGVAFGRVAVNISASQVPGENELLYLADVIRESGVPLSAIEFEFTESVLFQLDDDARRCMSELADAGLSFAIDDFGTGYSSLVYLRQFRLQKLKIEREFIADMLSDPGDLEIVKATIALGSALGMTVIAEGIENPVQLQLLRSNGCEQGQGYYYSRPLPSDELDLTSLETIS